MTITPITPRPTRQRHPALLDTPPGVWNPNGVGRVSGYPKTQEAYDIHKALLAANRDRANAKGIGVRTNVPNGYRGMGRELSLVRQQAANAGWELANVVLRNSLSAEERLTLPNDPMSATTDEARAAVAIAGLFAIALNVTVTNATRLEALQAVLPYLMPRPKGGLKLGTLDSGLMWLHGLANGEA